MMFVDGENFTIRGQTMAQDQGITLSGGTHYSQDKFLWVPQLPPSRPFTTEERELHLEAQARRCYYYTSVCGDDPEVQRVRTALRALDFDPQVFKKAKKDNKAKGVDIALTKDVLSHAFMNNYDSAVIVAGDGDYIPLVEEVKRLGKQVLIFFFSESGGLNANLRLSADVYVDITDYFISMWKSGLLV